METWMIIVIWLLCIIFGFLLGARYQEVSDNKSFGKLLNEHHYGYLCIDKSDPDAKVSVYAQYKKDPQTFTDGEMILMQVCVIGELKDDSQQNQGS